MAYPQFRRVEEDLWSDIPFISNTIINNCLAPGPMVYLNLAGQHMLILNDPKVGCDLLDRRAAIYSDRPRNIVAGEILTRGILLPLTRYGDLYASSCFRLLL
jgi:hypothetical protein